MGLVGGAFLTFSFPFMSFWLREKPKGSGGISPFPEPKSNLATPSQGHPSIHWGDESGQVSIVSSGTLVQSVLCQDIRHV